MKAEDIDWEEYKQIKFKDQMIGYLNGLRDWEGEHRWAIKDVSADNDLNRIVIRFICKECNELMPINFEIQSLAAMIAYNEFDKFFQMLETCPNTCKHENEEKKFRKQWIFDSPDKKMEIIEADLIVYCKDCGKHLRNETNQFSRDI